MRLVERRDVKAALSSEEPQKIASIGCFAKRALECGNKDFALTRGDHVRKRRQRLRVDERHGAADDDQRIAVGALGGISRDAGEAKEREHVHVIPFERHGKRDDVEFIDRRLRFECHERGPGRQQFRKLLFGRQEYPFAHDVVLRVEQAVHRLEAQVGHADPVGVGKCERHAQTIAMRLTGVADFLREGCERAFALLPGVQWCQEYGG